MTICCARLDHLFCFLWESSVCLRQQSVVIMAFSVVCSSIHSSTSLTSLTFFFVFFLLLFTPGVMLCRCFPQLVGSKKAIKGVFVCVCAVVPGDCVGGWPRDPGSRQRVWVTSESPSHPPWPPPPAPPWPGSSSTWATCFLSWRPLIFSSLRKSKVSSMNTSIQVLH